MLTRVNMIITHKCNLNCKHCYMDLSKRKQKTDNETLMMVKNLIEQLYILGTKEIMFTGGEVFTFKYIKEILEYSKSKGIKNIVFTNGLDVDYTCLDLIDQVNISLDGKEETHNKIRGNKNSYKKVIELIGKLKEKDIWTVLQMSVSDFNVNEIDSLDKLLLENLNIRQVNITKIITKGNAEKNNIFTSDKIDDIILQKIKEMYKKTKFHIQFKSNLISRYDFINNYVNEKPRLPLWINVVDEEYYLIENNDKYKGSIIELDKEKIEKMMDEIHEKIKQNKNIGNGEYIDIESLINSII